MASSVAQIRMAHHGDAPGILDCVQRSYGHYVERIGKPPAPMLDDYDELVAAGWVRVAIVHGTLVGLIVLWPEADHLYVDNIAVLPQLQGTGVGSALLAHADREAIDADRDEIRLYTNEAMTENLEYYRRRGFVETHRAAADGYQRIYFSRRLSTPEH